MPTTYTINVWNTTGQPRTYCIFAEQPTTTNKPNVFSNIYQTFDQVDTDGVANFSFTEDLYAWTGLAPISPAPGVVLSSGQSKPVDLGEKGTNGSSFTQTISASGSPSLIPDSVPAAVTGSFQVLSGDFDGSKKNRYLLGMAKNSPTSPFPVPVATFQAEPSTTYTITPITVFYVCEGSYTAGTIIDVSAISNTFKVDLTGGPKIRTIKQLGNKKYVDVSIDPKPESGFITGPGGQQMMPIKDALQTIGYFLHGLQDLVRSLTYMADNVTPTDAAATTKNITDVDDDDTVTAN